MIMNLLYRRAVIRSRKVLSRRGFYLSPKRRTHAEISTQEEPTGPKLFTSIPGPEAVMGIKELTKLFDTRSVNMLIDYDKCFGN